MKFPHTATVQSLNIVGNKEVYSGTISEPGFLQPLGAEAAANEGVTYTKGFRWMAPASSVIREKDILVISGVRYTVRGSLNLNFGANPHKNFTLEKIV